MTKKGFEVLRALFQSYGRDFIHVVIAAKDPCLQKDFFSEIERFCHEQNIPFFERKNSPLISTKYSFAISWRWKIPLEKKTKLIVFHDSLLPKYRGYAPLVNALINKEEKIGVTAIFACDNFDKGEIIEQSSSTIQYPIKIEKAIDFIIEDYKKLALNIAKIIQEKKVITSVKQNEKEASYSIWRDEKDYEIDWKNSSHFIKRFIDAVAYPYAGAYTFLNEKKCRILEAEIVEDVFLEIRHYGKVLFIINSKPVVICGKGLLKIQKAVDDANQQPILPLTKLRVRFGS